MAFAPPVPSNRPYRIPEIEGLRGLLAWWVVVDHILGTSGYAAGDELWGLARILRNGEYAVDVFVILSGFVICLLLDRAKEPYPAFITRRFFRIWPAMAVTFLFALAIHPMWSSLSIQMREWFSPERLSELAETNAVVYQHRGIHTLLHATMLHGLVPQSILLDAPGAFLSPAWSVSLEWQFYLIAPLCVWMASRSAGRVILFGLTALCVWSRHLLPDVLFGAALPFHAEYFLLGGLSYYAYHLLAQAGGLPEGVVRHLPAAVIGLAIVFSPAYHLVWQRGFLPLGPWIPLWIWSCFFASLLAGVGHDRRGYFMSFLKSAPLQYLGRVSYSTYLAHTPLIMIALWVTLPYLTPMSRPARFLVLSGIVFPLTLLASAFLYRFVEKPGISVGRKLVSR